MHLEKELKMHTTNIPLDSECFIASSLLLFICFQVAW